MISESQERMVAVVRPDRLAEAEAVCRRWELAHAVIGEVTDTGELRAFHEGEVVGEIPAALLTDECPRYRVERRPQADDSRARSRTRTLGSRRWIYERYDHLVGSRTVRRPGLDAAVLRLRPSRARPRGLARRARRSGSAIPSAPGRSPCSDAARNVACAGGEPIGLTDCLNFGNPEKPEIAWELEQAIEGIAQAAEALGIPVVSGNVSLYNDTDGRSIPPTPVVGCVGLVPDVRRDPAAAGAEATRSAWFEGASNTVLLGRRIGSLFDAELIGLSGGRLQGFRSFTTSSDGGVGRRGRGDGRVERGRG